MKTSSGKLFIVANLLAISMLVLGACSKKPSSEATLPEVPSRPYETSDYIDVSSKFPFDEGANVNPLLTFFNFYSDINLKDTSRAAEVKNEISKAREAILKLVLKDENGREYPNLNSSNENGKRITLQINISALLKQINQHDVIVKADTLAELELGVHKSLLNIILERALIPAQSKEKILLAFTRNYQDIRFISENLEFTNHSGKDSLSDIVQVGPYWYLSAWDESIEKMKDWVNSSVVNRKKNKVLFCTTFENASKEVFSFRRFMYMIVNKKLIQNQLSCDNSADHTICQYKKQLHEIEERTKNAEEVLMREICYPRGIGAQNYNLQTIFAHKFIKEVINLNELYKNIETILIEESKLSGELSK